MTALTPTQTNSIKLTAAKQTAAKLTPGSGNGAEIVMPEKEEIVFASDQYIDIRTSSDIEKYTGSYEVTPRANEDQVLQTKSKQMTDNVTIFQVPYYQTSNATGDTVYIASEV